VKRLVILGAGVAAIIAIAVVIWLGTRGSDDVSAPGVAPTPVARPVPAAGTSPTTTVTPSLPGSAAPATDSEGTPTYKFEGVTVHDHRGSNATAMDVPPSIHPPGTRTIPPSLTGAVAREIRRVLADCTRDMPAGSRGPRPRMDGEVVISIKDNKTTVTKALMQLHDTIGDVGPVRQCLEQKAVGLTTDGQGEADLDSYSIHVSFALGGGPPPPGP
jgi:hypothetical protein